MIWKSRPSRMRRATFRMTLESSTTKHLFITTSLSCSREQPAHSTHYPMRGASSRFNLRSHMQHPVNVENDQEPRIQSDDAGRNLRKPGIEISRVVLAHIIGERHHLADLIDQK